jgi:hypothetical protein
MTKWLAALIVSVAAAIAAALYATADTEAYVWDRLTEHAPYAGNYNYPVHVAPDGRFIALHPDGTWASRDGAKWTKTAMPFSGMNSAYLSYVQHEGATWALGKLKGNYLDFQIDPVIQRTRDYEKWEQVGASSSLPHAIFYATASFKGSLWIVGGYNGNKVTSEVWNSQDGLVWTRVVEQAPWSARSGAKIVIFRNKMFLIGGGVIDGLQANDVWSSADGVTWTREADQIAPEKPMGTPFVYDNKLWLVGANRSGTFESGMAVSDDGKIWRKQSAPWSPRGGVAAWTNGPDLFITGGKYSYEKAGEPVFVYSNDVWRMRRK